MTDLGDFGDVDEQADVDRGASSTDTSSTDSLGDLAIDVGDERLGIGTIAVSEGLSIGIESDDTRIRAYVTTGNRGSVKLGTYLIAPYPDEELLFCRITALEYAQEFDADDATEIHARRAMRESGFEERDYKYMATIEPVAILEPDGEELSRRMADRVPKPATIVRSATDRDEIKTGLDIPNEGVFFGHLTVGGQPINTAASPPTIDYRLRDDYADGDPLIFRHTLVAGGTGSGKTHATKNILRQYLGRSYPMDEGRTPELAIVQFDPQDEYAQMHDDNPALPESYEPTLERDGITYGGHADTLALVPTIGNITYDPTEHRAEWVPFTIPFSMVRDNPWLVAGSGLNPNQYQGLQELLRRYFSDAGGEATYRGFVNYLDDPILREELDESGRVHEATFGAILRRVRGFGTIFDQDATPITELVHELVRPGRLTTVPTYHISQRRAAETVVLAVSSLLIDEKLSSDPTYDVIKDTPLLIGMDEAHSFLSDAETVQATRVIGKFADAAKQGRKERLGLFLITQDPQDIAEPIFKQINTRVALNLGDEGAIDALNLPRSHVGRVPYMEKGGMVVHSPDNSEPVELQGLPYCVTAHGRD